MNKDICLKHFNDVMTEIFKFFYLMYRGAYKHECSNEKEVENLKIEIKNDDNINMENLRIKFSKYRRSTKYMKKFDEIYNRVCNKSLTTRNLALKFITSKMLSGQKYDYNDITDALNIASSEYVADETSYYITAEKSWIDFFEKYSVDNEYCDLNYQFIKQFVNYEKIN